MLEFVRALFVVRLTTGREDRDGEVGAYSTANLSAVKSSHRGPRITTPTTAD